MRAINVLLIAIAINSISCQQEIGTETISDKSISQQIVFAVSIKDPSINGLWLQKSDMQIVQKAMRSELSDIISL